MTKFEVIIENPKTRNRDSIILEDHEHDNLISDLEHAKASEPIQIPHYGQVSKSAYKGSFEKGSTGDKKTRYIWHDTATGERIHQKVIMQKNEKGELKVEYEPDPLENRLQRWLDERGATTTAKQMILKYGDMRVAQAGRELSKREYASIADLFSLLDKKSFDKF